MNKGMLNYKVIILVIFILSFAIMGCKKKQPESPFESQLPDTTSTLSVGVDEEMSHPTAVESDTVISQAQETGVESAVSGFTSPTSEDIQIALKNAGYYKGEIDGNIGPKSKQAILDFQKDNDLKSDGKVGPKTWSKLKEYLKSQQ